VRLLHCCPFANMVRVLHQWPRGVRSQVTVHTVLLGLLSTRCQRIVHTSPLGNQLVCRICAPACCAHIPVFQLLALCVTHAPHRETSASLEVLSPPVYCLTRLFPMGPLTFFGVRDRWYASPAGSSAASQVQVDQPAPLFDSRSDAPSVLSSVRRIVWLGGTSMTVHCG
jgi:hypothetical protein